jgi:predicted anti-sigma-YlaC factor YlaD
MTTRVDNDKTCEDVRDELVAVLDGTASAELYDHIADCDDCRDLRHDAAQAERVAARGGDDYQHPADFTAKLLATLDARPSSEPQVSGEKA